MAKARLFSKWKERFFIWTTKHLQCYEKPAHHTTTPAVCPGSLYNHSAPTIYQTNSQHNICSQRDRGHQLYAQPVKRNNTQSKFIEILRFGYKNNSFFYKSTKEEQSLVLKHQIPGSYKNLKLSQTPKAKGILYVKILEIHFCLHL